MGVLGVHVGIVIEKLTAQQADNFSLCLLLRSFVCRVFRRRLNSGHLQAEHERGPVLNVRISYISRLL